MKIIVKMMNSNEELNYPTVLLTSILFRIECLLFTRVFNNSELKGAPNMAKKRKNGAQIFFPKRAIFLGKGAQFLTPKD